MRVHGGVHGCVNGGGYGRVHGRGHGRVNGGGCGGVYGDVHGDVHGRLYSGVHGGGHGCVYGGHTHRHALPPSDCSKHQQNEIFVLPWLIHAHIFYALQILISLTRSKIRSPKCMNRSARSSAS